jgi:hypothetical protein
MVRKREDAYFPLFSEMQQPIYNTTLLSSFLALNSFQRLLFAELFPDTVFFDPFVFTALLSILLIAYQQHPWVSKEKKKRDQEIARITGKACLSKDEEEIIRETLISNGKTRYNPPIVWKMVSWILITLVIGAFINAVAAALTNSISTEIPFPNKLPPF